MRRLLTFIVMTALGVGVGIFILNYAGAVGGLLFLAVAVILSFHV